MIRLATEIDAHLIHKIMLSAFEEYRNSDVPSGALNETVTSIEEALRDETEQALLYYKDGIPAGTWYTSENSNYEKENLRNIKRHPI